MASINKVILIGRVGKDPETSFMPNGNSQITKFSLATSEFFTKNNEKQETTEWHNIVLWNKLSEIYKETIKKGVLVYLEGKIKTNKWQDKDGNNRYRTEIWANQLRILQKMESSNGGGYNNSNNYENSNSYNNNNFNDGNIVEDEDIPF
jgi:single-strand DNA-binding protein